MIEKVKAGKILGNISPFLKLYHPNIDSNLILFYLFKNFVYKDINILSKKRKNFFLISTVLKKPP